MKLKTAIIVSAWLCLILPIYGLLNGSCASQSAQSQGASQATSPAAAKQYKLGETIHLREGITLKIVPGSSKSVELFTSNQAVTTKSFILDLEFEIRPPSDGEALHFELGESVGKSGVFLNAGEENLMPKWWGWLPSPGAFGRPSAGRVEDGLHVGSVLLSGKSIASFLFELNSDQMKQKKKLALNFTFLPKERWSFVIDLDSKGN